MNGLVHRILIVWYAVFNNQFFIHFKVKIFIIIIIIILKALIVDIILASCYDILVALSINIFSEVWALIDDFKVYILIIMVMLGVANCEII